MKKQIKTSVGTHETGLRKPTSKAAGTRAGILLDWREGNARSGKTSGGSGKTLRDGR